MSFSRVRLVLGLSLALSFGLAQDGAEALPPPPSAQSRQDSAPDPTPAGEARDAQTPDTEEDPETQGDEAQDAETQDVEVQDAPAPLQRTVPAGAEPLSKLRLTREDRVTVVNQYAPGAEGGQFILRAPDCGEEARRDELLTSTVYGGDAYLVETLVNETRITSPIVFQKSPPKEAGGNDKARLEMFGGTLAVNAETLCPEDLAPGGQPEVKLEQGRTTVDGYQGVYDNATGIFEMGGGRVDLNRTAEGDSPALTADAGGLKYDEATGQIVLRESVIIESDGRVSEADSVEFDDANSVAVLTGSPATSRKGDEFFQGNVITYYLDSNDVKVTGDIQGELILDLGTEAPNTTEATPNGDTPQTPDLNPSQ